MTLCSEWLPQLLSYDCRPVQTVGGGEAIVVSTPFALLDDLALNLYVCPMPNNRIRVTDNGDTLFGMHGLGLDIWGKRRMGAARKIAADHGIEVGDGGEVYAQASQQSASLAFARCISAILVLSDWATKALNLPPKEKHDLAAEVEPYLVRRRPGANIVKNPKLMGATHQTQTFNFLQGHDLIDVLQPSKRAVGAYLRKLTDVMQGPDFSGMHPMVILEDRDNPEAAHEETRVLTGVTSVLPMTTLMVAG